MTVKEFYEYMKEKGAENYEMGNDYYDGYGANDVKDWYIDEEEEQVYTKYEC